jgi:taurine dioxygenase
MTLELQPLHGIGAAVRGVDISKPLDPQTADALGRAWAEHLILVFPGQTLDDAAQIRFAGAFGKVGERSRPPERRPEGVDYNGAIMLVSNIRRNGVPIGSLPDGEMWFHHDMCYVEKPHRGTFLYAIEVPSTGGNTKFANMSRAYDSLPQRLKDRIRGRRALHVYDYGTAEKIDIEKRGLDGIKHHWHPVAIRHPISGRMALYVNRLMTVQIEGLPRAESDAVLLELFDYAENPANVYEHAWTPGDLIMWDNYASMHARTDFPASERRLLRRCTIEGAYIPAE